MSEQKSIVQVRNEIRRFHEAAREVLEQTNLDVSVRKGSDEATEYFRSRRPEMRWLARLPEDRREAVRRMWETHERLANLIEAAVHAAPKGAKAQLKDLADGVLGELRWIVLPYFWNSGDRPVCYEPAEEATVEPREAEIDNEGRLTVLDEQIAKLDVLLEEAEAAGMKAFSLSPTDGSAGPTVDEDELEEVKGLLKRLEGPYIDLVEGMALKEVKNVIPEKPVPFIPAGTPRHCFDWDGERRSPEQAQALPEVQGMYRTLRLHMESILGMPLGTPRPLGSEDAPPPPWGEDQGALLARQCDEALYWLGTVLPLGEDVPRCHGGYASAEVLRAEMNARIDVCFSNLRQVIRGLEKVVEQRAQEAKREDYVLARQGDMWRLAYAGREVFAKHSMGLLVMAYVIQKPGRGFPMKELHALVAARPDRPKHGSLGEILDEQAIRELKEAVCELRRDIETAKAGGDFGKQERLALELSTIEDELCSAIGLGGRPRRFTGSAENARTVITRAVKTAMEDIEKKHKALGEHLRAYIQTGNTCCYVAVDPPPWQIWTSPRVDPVKRADTGKAQK